MSWKNNGATERSRYLITIHFLSTRLSPEIDFFKANGAVTILAAPENHTRAMAWRTDSIVADDEVVRV